MKTTFSGIVSQQAEDGEQVTVSVKGDNPITLLAETDKDGAYEVYTDLPAGEYTASAHIDPDDEFGSADSLEIPFTVGLSSRTVTLNVSLG